MRIGVSFPHQSAARRSKFVVESTYQQLPAMRPGKRRQSGDPATNRSTAPGRLCGAARLTVAGLRRASSSHLRAVWAAVWLSPQHDPADPYAVAAVIDVSLAVTAFWPAVMLAGDIGPRIGLRTPQLILRCVGQSCPRAGRPHSIVPQLLRHSGHSRGGREELLNRDGRG